MSWHITVTYGNSRPTLWSYGYPTKRAAERARARLNAEKTSPDTRYQVKRTP